MIDNIGYIEPVLHIKPEKFSIENIENYELRIEIGATYFRFAIKDEGMFISLEDFQYPVNQTKTEFIKTIFNEHPYLSARFWKNIKVILHSEKKTIVPGNINEEQASQVWISLYGQPKDTSSILYTNIGTDSVIFETNKQQLDFFLSFYDSEKITITLAETLLPFTGDQETYLLFDGKGCHITYSSPQLNCYYTPDWKQRVNGRDDRNVLLVGEITEYAIEFKQLVNEIKHARKTALSQSIRLSNNFGQIAKFRYFIIFNS